ncbi:DNA polymerase IV, partial [bacterium]|nr:DNA polymerase IV [bacterium]
VDLNQFFAAVEIRDNPALRGKPLIVGGNAIDRGIVTTATYEARRYGISSGMALSEAAKLCPHGVFITPTFHKYADASRRVREILVEFTDRAEMVSIDEACLDVTDVVWGYTSPEALGREIQKRIREQVGITASIGAGANRTVAKMASGMKKPEGFVYLPPSKVMAVYGPMEVSELIGVGRSTTRLLTNLGIRTIGDLANYPVAVLEQHMGKRGRELQQLARGGGRDIVVPSDELPDEKSVSHETTFYQDIKDVEVLKGRLSLLCEKVARRMRAARLAGRVVTIRIRYHGFETYQHQHKYARFLSLESDIFVAACALLDEQYEKGRPVRLIGIGVSELCPMAKQSQQELFGGPSATEKKLAEICDEVRGRYGDHMLEFGTSMLSPRSSNRRSGNSGMGVSPFRFDGMNG